MIRFQLRGSPVPILQALFLACALLGTASALEAQDTVPAPATESAPPEPPKCIPNPYVQEHWLVARGMPYSGKRVMTCKVVEPDGTVVTAKRTQLEWRDSEGRRRLEQPDSLAEDTIMVQIVDPVEHLDWNFSIDKGVDKTAFVSRYNPRADSFVSPTTYHTLPGGGTNRRMMARPLVPEGPGYRDDELRSTYVNGVWCEGSRYSHWDRPGEGNNKSDHNELEVTETWYSVDLFTEVRWRMNSPSLGEYRNDLINIDRSEPDAALFRPPSGYRVVETNPVKAVPESNPPD